MKKIVIKEIDKLTSTLHKSRVTSEYLIYLVDDKIILEGYTEIGEIAKNARVNELILTNFISDNFNQTEIKTEDIIEEINFEEYLNQNTPKKTWKKVTL